MLKKRVINDRAITSLHMQEGTKQNMNQVCTIIMMLQGDLRFVELKRRVFKMLARKLIKNLDKMKDAIDT